VPTHYQRLTPASNAATSEKPVSVRNCFFRIRIKIRGNELELDQRKPQEASGLKIPALPPLHCNQPEKKQHQSRVLARMNP